MRGKRNDQQMKERLARRETRKKKDFVLIAETTRVPTRKEMRAIARANMQKADIPKICKKRSDGASFFAKHWREWAFKKVRMPKKRRSA